MDIEALSSIFLIVLMLSLFAFFIALWIFENQEEN